MALGNSDWLLVAMTARRWDDSKCMHKKTVPRGPNASKTADTLGTSGHGVALYLGILPACAFDP